ncbi:magnesium chelatase subunit D [Roseomonas sp. JC162]|uniref:Magnesium chelatase subunit D n=1 Tax=Neoroseomonas marina TaxID=1232220 RepID=A0A848EG34_9PROT|nr:magnesium chelatase subunit D [Neoroseomonas marina]
MTEAAASGGDAAMAAALLAVDPGGLCGVVLQAPHGVARDAWLARLRGLLRFGAPWRRLPPDAPDDRLIGGIDLAATLATGRLRLERGALAESNGGVVVIPMAERLTQAAAARYAAVLDTAEVTLERDGAAARWPASLAVVALDESTADDERIPAGLADRLALRLPLSPGCLVGPGPDAARVANARGVLGDVRASDEVLRTLCEASLAFGIGSPRAPALALRTARAAAALADRRDVAEADVVLAARLVLAPRATCLPATPEEAPPPAEEQGNADGGPPKDGSDLSEIVVSAMRAALPPGLLAALASALRGRAAASDGRSGAPVKDGGRGRVLGSRPGPPRGGRVALIATLRAAAPWQTIRRRAKGDRARPVLIRAEDIRLRRHEARRGTTTLFAVDASGSSALHRLAEAKGAIELLLGECYARRDRVGLLAFRGTEASTVLPPTQAPARARRCLAALPGGGATPLASAIDLARIAADGERRQGRQPLLVLVTDARPNVARDGRTGRDAGEADALAAAALLRAAGVATLMVDTAPRPHAYGRVLAGALGARYVALPQADAAALSTVVAAARSG